jgi:GTPase SAR1 family protein
MGSSQTKHTPKPNPRKLRVCVIGLSGCGKSAFINAIRGYELLYNLWVLLLCVYILALEGVDTVGVVYEGVL